MAELIPYPFEALVRRMFAELERHDAIFDLPRRRFFTGDPERDYSVRFHGHRASSPLGPAAGPQTQMAQNLVLSWLGGSRIMELKTVQILDELEIPRPCIDMQTVGFNAEWSQELKLQQSLDEYVKGAMLVEMLRGGGAVEPAANFGDVVFDMSVGYDLKGIRSAPVRAFIEGMMDATGAVERFRAQIPAAHAGLRDLEFPTRLSDTVTLSTFHGCPSDEIEGIIDHLMREYGLHCVVKFNPTLLGRDPLMGLLHDRLGYVDINVPESAFTRDTNWDQATAFMERLGETAETLGLSLGAKFSNTLIVHNERGFLPASEKEVYLSGQPLHVLAMNLVARFRERFGDRFPISFAAGVDRGNFAEAVALGLTPITVCTDLLRPQGYGRLQGYYRDLARAMVETGAQTVDDHVLRAHGQAEAALDRAGVGPADPKRAACLAALADRSDLFTAAGPELYPSWVSAARLLNTEVHVPRVTADPRYGRAKTAKTPKKIGSALQLFDCVSCDKCIPVCPNDANFSFVPAATEIPMVHVRREGAGWTWQRFDPIVLAEKHQIGNFADFCNECGNCDIFCPEDGGPYLVKPRFFGSEASWLRFAGHDGFHLDRRGGADLVLWRAGDDEHRAEFSPERTVYTGDGFVLSFDPRDPEGSLEVTATAPGDAAAAGAPAFGGGPASGASPPLPDVIDLTYLYVMDSIRSGVLDPETVNYVNVLVSGDAPAPGASGGEGPDPQRGNRS